MAKKGFYGASVYEKCGCYCAGVTLVPFNENAKSIIERDRLYLGNDDWAPCTIFTLFPSRQAAQDYVTASNAAWLQEGKHLSLYLAGKAKPATN